MSAAPSILHEIYVKDSGDWVIHANYTPHEGRKCISDAEELYNSGRFEAMRVIKESYDPEENMAREEILYRSPCRHKSVRIGPGPGTGMPRSGKSVRRNVAGRVRQKPKSDILRDGPRFIVVAVIAFIGAAFAAYFLRAFLEIFMAWMKRFYSMIALVFVLIFVSIFAFLMLRFKLSVRELGSKRARVARRAVPNADIENVSITPAPQVRGGSRALSLNIVDAEDEPPVNAGEDLFEEEPSEPDAQSEEEMPLWDEATEVSADLLRFTGNCLELLAAIKLKMDAFNRFGMTFFFAGAAEYLASKRELFAFEKNKILCAHIQILGHSPDVALRFCDNVDQYVIHPKYFGMYEAGRDVMMRHLDDSTAEPGVVEAVEAWNKRATVITKREKEFVAVLFTDIVGSTAMTQERGDDAAQLVVRLHDVIVRDALTQHGDREIKHIGNGIMARFSTIASAVDGAIDMQRACERANADDAELGLGLCIGINAGEPIHEYCDLFGTPVQIAARVLGEAESDEIAVSNLVREICVGKHYGFAKKGDFELKGIAEPTPVYLVD